MTDEMLRHLLQILNQMDEKTLQELLKLAASLDLNKLDLNDLRKE